jgi:hypothetical protein
VHKFCTALVVYCIETFVMQVAKLAADPGVRLYLDLMKQCLTRILFPDRRISTHPSRKSDLLKQYLKRILFPDRVRGNEFSLESRTVGRDWPTEAETMIGLRRLENVEACTLRVIEDGIPGDLVEAGVWRGGASILMRAVLKAYGDRTRRVWLADSFCGLPAPDPVRYPRDIGDMLHTFACLAVSLPEVKRNFTRYGLLDDQVCFLEGWFKDILPTAPINQIAVLRLDCDMYESTTEVLVHLYDRVSPGGYVIIDDYGCIANCKAAVDYFRQSRRITDPIQQIDWSGIFWRRPPILCVTP